MGEPTCPPPSSPLVDPRAGEMRDAWQLLLLALVVVVAMGAVFWLQHHLLSRVCALVAPPVEQPSPELPPTR